MHETDIVRLEAGRTVEDVRAWFNNQERDPLPGTIAGGCMDSHDLKRVTWVKRSFSPGRYVFYCDMPMIQNARPTLDAHERQSAFAMATWPPRNAAS
jgi:hypothetical protein